MSKYLAIIPARGGSKRIPHKNTRLFNKNPLIYYTIKQAKDSGIFDRIIVDTEDLEIARIAKKYGAEVPYLRPRELAQDKSKVLDAIELLVRRLKEDNYNPDILCVLQTTSPLREVQDIRSCHKIMSDPRVNSVCTLVETSPWFYNLSRSGRLVLMNKKSDRTTNTQEVPRGYMLNGSMVYMVRTKRFLKTKKFVDMNTIGVVCPRWRSVDLDHIEDWVLAEFIHKNVKKIYAQLAKF